MRIMMKKIFLFPVTWGILAALLVTIPQMHHSQFRDDDYVQLAVLAGKVTYPWMGCLNLYSFVSGNPADISYHIARGPSVWSMNPATKVNFFRPLSSALMALNFMVSGLTPLGYTVHSLLWYLAAIFFLGLFLLRIFPQPRSNRFHPALYLVLVMFAVSTSHFPTLFWNAARWILVSVTFGLAGLVAHLKWREEHWRPGRFISLLAVGMALLAGEASLAILAFLAAYEFFDRADTVKKRLSALLPIVSMVAVYLAVYRLMGCGTAGIEAYMDPFNDAIAFLTALPSKWFAMFGELFLGAQSSLWYFPQRRPEAVLTGAAALLLAGCLLFPLWKSAFRRQRRRINWVVLGMLGSLIPLSSRTPNPHIMIIPFIGGSVLLGFICHYWWRCVRKRFSLLRGLALLACAVLIYVKLILPPFSWFQASGQWQAAHARLENIHRYSVFKEIRPDQKVVFLNFSDWGLEFHGYYYRKLYGLPMPYAWWRLTTAITPLRYHRIADDKMEMEVMNFSSADSFEKASGKNSYLEKGKIIWLSGLQVKILETVNNRPKRVELEFSDSLGADTYQFLEWRKGRLHKVTPPSIGHFMQVGGE